MNTQSINHKGQKPLTKTRAKTRAKRNTSNRRWGVRPLGKLMGRDARRAFRKFGFNESTIITRWRQIVGDELAECSLPLKLWFKKGQKTDATLHIMVEGAFAVQLHHLGPLIIEKVNIFYGYKAVGDLNISQGPVRGRRRQQRRPVPELGADDRAALNAMVDKTHDDDLKEALDRLGTQILGSSQSGKDKT